MKEKSIILFFLLFYFSIGFCQGDYFTLGIEGQQHRDGLFPGVRAELALSDQLALGIKIGINVVDLTRTEKEIFEDGNGSAASLGLRYYFSNDYDKLFLGGRADFSRNRIDWAKGTDSGTSNVITTVPNIMTGYVFQLGDHFRFTPNLAAGYKINVQNEGESVQSGPVLLWGLNFEYRI